VRLSELGLVEMTRKRTRESLGRTLHEPCFYCDGTGTTASKTTVCHEILRQLRREKDQLPGYKIVINAHPAICDMLQREKKAHIEEAQVRFTRQIVLSPRREYHLEQFDLTSA
jgi:ribonuclease G